MAEETGEHLGPARPRLSAADLIALALVLVFAHHAVPYWLLHQLLPAYRLYRWLGPGGYSNLWDTLALLLPLTLCLAAPARSGLRVGSWRPHAWKLLAICAGPVAVTALVNPLTSEPFAGDRIGTWLISPAAQDLLFTGYLYGLLSQAWPRRVHPRVAIPVAALIVAGFFCLWHVPNFASLQAQFVAFQLVYTFLGGLCFLMARHWTGSILPGLFTHMGCNFIAWTGW